MATLTIRDFDDALKHRLRLRAASRNRSMEEEVRQILRSALHESPPATSDLAARIRSRFAGVAGLAGLGGVELPQPVREPVRRPPVFDTPPRSAAKPAARKPRRA